VAGKGSGRVIESTSNDNIFVFFAGSASLFSLPFPSFTPFLSDHGAPGILAFPTHGPFGLALHADKLQDTIAQMHDDNKYSKMILYVEACESGSMFNKILPGNMSVYAVTASTPFESSYACYEDSYAHTYIGDCFSNHVRAAARLAQQCRVTFPASGWRTRMPLTGRPKRCKRSSTPCAM
jgi:legumain